MKTINKNKQNLRADLWAEIYESLKKDGVIFPKKNKGFGICYRAYSICGDKIEQAFEAGRNSVKEKNEVELRNKQPKEKGDKITVIFNIKDKEFKQEIKIDKPEGFMQAWNLIQQNTIKMFGVIIDSLRK